MMPVGVRLEIPRTATPGGRARLALVLTNESVREHTLYLRGRSPVFDFMVRDERGRIVWQRLAGETIPAIIGLVTLAPRARHRFVHDWALHDQRGVAVQPGRYAVTGQLLTDGEPLVSSPGVLIVRR